MMMMRILYKKVQNITGRKDAQTYSWLMYVCATNRFTNISI